MDDIPRIIKHIYLLLSFPESSMFIPNKVLYPSKIIIFIVNPYSEILFSILIFQGGKLLFLPIHKLTFPKICYVQKIIVISSTKYVKFVCTECHLEWLYDASDHHDFQTCSFFVIAEAVLFLAIMTSCWFV